MKFFLLILFLFLIFLLRPIFRIIRILFFTSFQNKNRENRGDDGVAFNNTVRNSQKIIKEDEGEYVEFEEVEDAMEDKK